MKRLCAGLVFLAASGVWTTIHAEPQLEATGSLGVGFDKQPGRDMAVVSPEFVVRAFVSESEEQSADLHLSLGLAATGDAEGRVFSHGDLRMGNPWLSAGFARSEASFGWRVGFGIAAPLAHVELGGDGRLVRTTLNHAMGLRGLWNVWMWTPDRLSFPALGALLLPLSRGHLQFSFAAAPLWRVRGEDLGEGAVGFVAQSAVDACLHNAETSRLCLRGQMVSFPQSSLNRFHAATGVRLTMATWRLRPYAALLVNLTPPLGLSRGAHLWGIFLGTEVGS